MEPISNPEVKKSTGLLFEVVIRSTGVLSIRTDPKRKIVDHTES